MQTTYMEKVEVLVCKPKENKKTFNAFADKEVAGHVLYGCGFTAREAVEDMIVMLEEINASNAGKGIAPVEADFAYKYDVAALFSCYSYLNISEVARRMGINPGLMRRYASGETMPSDKRLREIERCLKELAAELAGVSLMADRGRTA